MIQFPSAFTTLSITVLLIASCDINPDEDYEDYNGGGGEDPPFLSKYFGSPAWHPNGKWIAAGHGDSLDTDGDGQNDEYFGGIWLVDSESGTTHPLMRGFGYPAWSPDGTLLAMGAGGHIFTIKINSQEPAEVDTNTLFQLTFEGGNFFPDWSPNGQWIVYDSNVDDTKYDIWIMDSDGKNKKNISLEGDSLDQGGWRKPNWSPDGKYIVHERYFSDANGPPDIVIMDTSGHNAVRLTSNGSADQNPQYSPDGTKIAWQAHRELPSGFWAMDIWIMESDGSYPHKITSDHAWSPDWSPDGNQLVFLFWDPIDECPGNGQLWITNVDGSGLRQLTHYQP